MPTLTLKFKENTISEYELPKGGSLTIGRLNDNQVVIENLAVSSRHAKIDSVGDGYLLTDLQSKNGSFVNSEKVSSHWLKNGDVITIGKHTLIFSGEGTETAGARPKAIADMDKTMVMDTAAHREMVAKSRAARQTQPESQPEPAGTGNAVLMFLTGGQEEYELTKKVTKIGKDTTSDIVVGGFFVGKTAANINKRPKGYFLAYVSGFSKPKVNGVAVKESVQLNEGDKIEIGSTKMEFTLSKG